MYGPAHIARTPDIWTLANSPTEVLGCAGYPSNGSVQDTQQRHCKKRWAFRGCRKGKPSAPAVCGSFHWAKPPRSDRKRGTSNVPSFRKRSRSCPAGVGFPHPNSSGEARPTPAPDTIRIKFLYIFTSPKIVVITWYIKYSVMSI